jgi:curli biogenesis system outer membrane secretion channel CsgG
MWNIITIDGYFEGLKNWDLSFHETIWGQELEKLSIEQLKSADYLVFGRVTYEGMAAHWTKAEKKIICKQKQQTTVQISKVVILR